MNRCIPASNAKHQAHAPHVDARGAVARADTRVADGRVPRRYLLLFAAAARARARAVRVPQSSPTHRRSDRRGDGVTVSDETQLIGYPPRVRVVTQGPGTLQDGGDRVYLPTLFVAPALVLVA